MKKDETDLDKYKRLKILDYRFNGNMPREEEKATMLHGLNNLIATPVNLNMVSDSLKLRQLLCKLTDEEIIESLRDKFPEKFI